MNKKDIEVNKISNNNEDALEEALKILTSYEEGCAPRNLKYLGNCPCCSGDDEIKS